MSEKKRMKSLEEVEVELEYFGLSRQSAAAMVRLANNLKQVRKLRAAHIELLVPGRRLHPPSPLGQIVWNQGELEIEIEIIEKLEGQNGHDNEPEQASRNEASGSEATTDMNVTEGAVLSSVESATLDNVTSSLENLSIPQNTSPSPPERSADILAKEAEGEYDPYDTPHNRDDFRWW
ncbi:hypothetical protein N5P37_009307 [Trichoderma harzianum]|uniref:Uncharacterized protein n=1 Tax=Trichoderma harzianum CBS 226.95 TaxID=983964 RepID=A0A2T4A8J3_TRIHA|nr:hypothetical protein M431DRAFT_6861 [Trichoderma harzianum CBS 226.95]KAK0758009.1 hypothetical protein N5P37_009307 [Trichoderma harzianum]PTB53313.1 hypothetical protein M431DRAFT_6861 [Trichoderma harzianum CBS 226.95]